MAVGSIAHPTVVRFWDAFELPKKGQTWSDAIDQVRAGADSLALPEGFPSVLAQRLAGIKVTVSKVSMHLDDAWREKFVRQLELLLDEEEWDAAFKVPTEESFQTLLRVLLFLKPVVRPGLSAAPSGLMSMSWAEGDDRLTIECLAADHVRWVLSRTVEGERERAAGENNLNRLGQVLKPYRPEKWFERAGN